VRSAVPDISTGRMTNIVQKCNKTHWIS